MQAIIFLMAPEVGIEPTTQWLHGSLCFPKGVDYIITLRVKGVRRFPPKNKSSEVLPYGIVSEPYPTGRILAADYHIHLNGHRGFQQFTSFFDLDYSRKLRLISCVHSHLLYR